jgi:hypothetical protein
MLLHVTADASIVVLGALAIGVALGWTARASVRAWRTRARR